MLDSEKNGIIDSMMEVPSSDRVTLKFAYRAIYFSLLCLYKINNQNQMLQKIILKCPVNMPDFDALDLWLQRKSAGLLYKSNGIDFFIKNFDSIRALILFYLVYQEYITANDQDALIKKLDSQYGQNKDYEFYFEAVIE